MALNKIKVNNTSTVNTGVVYDITKATGQSYTDLKAALGTNGNNVPSEVREGGMSIRFVQTSDNKYVQYRLMLSTFTAAQFTNAINWQGVDENPVGNSKNVIESGGVYPIEAQVKLEETVTLETVDVNVKLDKMIPVGSTIKSIHGYSGILRGRTNSGDATWFGLTDGVITDRDINYVNGSVTGNVTITVESIDTKITDLQQSINTEAQQRQNGDNALQQDIAPLKPFISAVSIPVTVTFTNDTSFKKLPFTIKAGSYLVNTNPESKVHGAFYGKTTASGEYFAITRNTTLNADVNYIRYDSYSGDITFIFNGLYEDSSELKEDVADIQNYLRRNLRKLPGSIISNKLHPYNGTHYMIPVKAGDEILISRKTGVSHVAYAILKSFTPHANADVEYATGCSLVVIQYSEIHKEIVPEDGHYLYVLETAANELAGMICINGWDLLADDVLTSLVKTSTILDNTIRTTVIVPEVTFNTSGSINKVGIKNSSSAYKISNTIAVKRNDIIKIDRITGSPNYCVVAKVCDENGIYTPLKVFEQTDVPQSAIYQFDEDCNICISGYQLVATTVKIYRTIDDTVVKSLNNALKTDIDRLNLTRNIFNPAEAVDNTGLDTSSPYQILDRPARWTTGFIPIDEDTNLLNCNYAHRFCVLYDENKVVIDPIFNQKRPIEVNAFANPSIKYIRLDFEKTILSFDDRHLLRITKTTVNEPKGDTPMFINGNKMSIKNPAYVTNEDIKQFEATLVFGAYVSSKSFTVDSVAETLDTQKVYIDKSTRRQYRYDGSALYDIGYYDNKSMIFTQSFSVFIPKNEMSFTNLIVAASAKYYQQSGVSDKPTIRLRNRAQMMNNNFTQSTIRYIIGGDRGFKFKEWRAFPIGFIYDKTEIVITIPAGVTLFIDRFGNFYSDKKGYMSDTHPRVNAHAFSAPDNSIAYFEANAKMGFSCMITIPKRTFDGVWVCFHDDDNITNYARHEDGTSLTNADLPQNAPETITEIGNCPIGYFTYEELMKFDFGIYGYEKVSYKGQKIPLLKDFFMICAKTGIHPMLSVHPNWTESEWLEIKAMTDKLSLTEKLNLKFAGGEDFFGTTYPVFGDEIESYAIDVSTDRDAAESMSNLIKTLEIDLNKVRVGIEYFTNVITEQKVMNAINAGLFAAKVMDGDPISDEYEYWMSIGVSEFTDDDHTSVGLNW